MIVTRASIHPIDFDGLQIYDYTAEQVTSSSLAVIQVPPGGRHAEAWSKCSDKYYYVITGNIQFMLDGDEHHLTAGDFCLVQRGKHFSYENRTDELAILLLVHTPRFDLASEVFVQEK